MAYVCSQVTRQRWVPEQSYIAPREYTPPTEAQTLYDYNLGWNAGARSILYFQRNGYVQFSASQANVACVCGLNNQNNGTDYQEIEYAFHLDHGVVRIMESGVDKLYVGTFTSTDVFKIDRFDGEVKYYQNGTLVYTSLIPSTDQYQFLDVSLYSGGDMVYNPSVYGYSEAYETLPIFTANGGGAQIQFTVEYQTGVPAGTENAFPPLQAFGGNKYGHGEGLFGLFTSYGYGHDLAEHSEGLATLPAFTSSGRNSPRNDISLQPFDSVGGNVVFGQGIGTMSPMEAGYCVGGMLIPSYALGSVNLGLFMVGSVGLTGEIGGGESVMPAMGSLGSEVSYGEAYGVMAPMQAYGLTNEAMDNASMGSAAVGLSFMVGQASMDLQVNSNAVLEDVLFSQILLDGSVTSSATLTDSFSLSQLLEAILADFALVSTSVGDNTSGASGWSLNVDNMASSRYESYPFNSFGKFDGHYFGAQPEGVFLLEGELDETNAIRASIDIGKKDFGTTALKGMPAIYVGMAATGDMVVKVQANDKEYLYATRRSDTFTKIQRIDSGKGLRANYFGLEFFNTDGCDFELDSIEFAPVILSRRI